MKFLFPFFRTSSGTSSFTVGAQNGFDVKFKLFSTVATLQFDGTGLNAEADIDINAKASTFQFSSSIAGKTVKIRNITGNVNLGAASVGDNAVIEIYDSTLSSTLIVPENLQGLTCSNCNSLVTLNFSLGIVPPYLTFDQNITTLTFPMGSSFYTVGGNVNFFGCALSLSSVDTLLSVAASSGGAIVIDISGGTNAAPTGGAGNADIVTIVANGGSVTHN